MDQGHQEGETIVRVDVLLEACLGAVGKSGKEVVEDVLVLYLLVALEDVEVLSQVGEDGEVGIMIAEVGVGEL